MKRQLRLRGRVACSFDEWSTDVVVNRVVRSGIARLIPLVSRGVAHDLAFVDRAFAEVGREELSPNLFHSLVVSPGHRHYGFAIDLCALLARWSLPAIDGRGRAFIDPRKSEQEMGWLFETFVRSYLQKHLQGQRVRGERQLDWALQPESPSGSAILPAMFTDIRLSGSAGLAVIEAKYTNEALPAGRDGKRRIRASHLYQLHAYVTHLERLHLGVPRAILLIGHPGAAFTHRYRMGDGEWTVVAVDLRESWSSLCASVVAAATPPTRAFAASLVPLGGSKPT